MRAIDQRFEIFVPRDNDEYGPDTVQVTVSVPNGRVRLSSMGDDGKLFLPWFNDLKAAAAYLRRLADELEGP